MIPGDGPPFLSGAALSYISVGLIGHSKNVFFAQISVVCATPHSAIALKYHDNLVINGLVKAHPGPGDPTLFFVYKVFGAL